MNRIKVTKEFTFEMAHALLGYDGDCRNIHGHSYSLSVTVSGVPETDPDSPKNGMVIDFGDLKKIIREAVVNDFDHALVLNSNTPSAWLGQMDGISGKTILVGYQPTSENLVQDFAQRILLRLPPQLKLTSVKLRETATSYVEWMASVSDSASDA
ncbi:MAG: 6-carboxytetrahydropterin synthase [Bacteroidales bacterium]|nr:6-carboxytetrahydropterin synthase [Bacteroidales bacterium]